MKLHAFIIAVICITVASSIFPDDFGGHIRRKRSPTAANESEGNPLLPRHVTPVGYHVWLQPFPLEGYFQGRVEVNISCLTPTSTVFLHAGKNLNISKAEISVIEPKDSFEDYRDISKVSVLSVLKGSPEEWCEVKLSDYLQQGLVYQLTMEFASDLRNGSCDEAMYYGNYDNGCSDKEDKKAADKRGESVERWFVATKMRKNKARKVFPCFDELTYKAPFVISIGRPEKMKSLSNMALRQSERMLDQPGWVWDNFEMTPPMSTFSVNLFVFDPDVIVPLEPRRDLGSTTLHIYAPVELQSDLQNVADKILKSVKKIETYLQMKYPLPDLQIVVAPGVWSHHDGFGLSVFSDDEKSYMWPLLFLTNIADQWLLHLTTPQTWSETLGNSLSFYVSYTGYIAALANTKEAPTHAWGTVYTMIVTTNPHNPHASAIGTMVLRMLNYTLGENTLRSALDSFLQDRLYETYVSNDIVAAIDDQAQRRSALPAGVTVPKIVDSWMKYRQFPFVTVTRNYKTRTAYVEQHAFSQNKSNGSSERRDQLWYVPLVLVRGDQREGRPLDEVVWMKEEQAVTLANMPPSNSFIIVDPDAIGLFVVNYDTNNWKLIIQHLQTKGSSVKLSATTRAKLMTDAGLLANEGQLTYDVPLDLSLMLMDENDVEPFYAFSEFFWHLHNKLQYTRMKTLLQEYIWKLFLPLYEQYGGYNEEELRVDTTIQGVLTTTMCRYGAEDCVAALVAKYKPGNLKYEDCIALQWGDNDIWDETLMWSLGHNKDNTTDSRVLKYLASCTLQEERVEKLLEAVLLKYNTVSDEDVLRVLDMFDNPYALFNFLSYRWSEIKKKYERKPDVLQKLVSKITSAFVTSDGYDLVSDFYAARQHDAPSLLPVLREAMETITEHMKWTDRNLPQIESWLHRYITRY